MLPDAGGPGSSPGWGIRIPVCCTRCLVQFLNCVFKNWGAYVFWKPVIFPSPRAKDWRPPHPGSPGEAVLLRERPHSVPPTSSAKSRLAPREDLRGNRPQEERAGWYYCESESQRGGSEGEARVWGGSWAEVLRGKGQPSHRGHGGGGAAGGAQLGPHKGWVQGSGLSPGPRGALAGSRRVTAECHEV